jgi:ABC-type proline/glycine betaine transport system permease subunit
VVIAGVICVTALALAADGLFRLIEWTLSPYRRPLSGPRRSALDATIPEHV